MKNSIICIIACLLVITACKKEDAPTCQDNIQNGIEAGVDCGGDCPPCSTIEEVSISGKAQKGPFINGSSVTLFELESNFQPTGRNFNTQILDNAGNFSLTGYLSSKYATTRVDGFYYNEVCGVLSNSLITLNGIVQIDTGAVNLNVLTHLEKSRVEYLLGTGLAFDVAKTQAQTEILAIFNIVPNSNLLTSESLDISKSSEGDAILIAVSSLLQGFRTESAFSLLMADIITDIRTDGVLNSTSIIDDLLIHAHALDTTAIKGNIENRYSEFGMTITVPSFGNYISNFLANNTIPQTGSLVDYPLDGAFGENILHLADTTLVLNTFYSFNAIIPSDCLGLEIEITYLSGSCSLGCWGIDVASVNNWAIGVFDMANRKQLFTPQALSCDLRIVFDSPGSYSINYLENGAVKSKTIMVN